MIVRKPLSCILPLELAAVLLLGCVQSRAAEPADWAQALVQPYVDRGQLAGAVILIVSKSRVLSLDAVGYSDLATKTPLRTDALFQIASTSKPFTATALMMLVDAGKVRLDDPVTNYLPDFRPLIDTAAADHGETRLHAPAHPITVRNLLTHTSGLGLEFAVNLPTEDSLPLATRVEGYGKQPLLYEPGSQFLYSNANINTVGRIIEVVTGMRYEDFMQRRLFGPLGMTDTTFYPTAKQLQRLAKSYKVNQAGTGLEEAATPLHYPLSDPKHRYPVPAWGLFSTATDLGKFCQMMLNGGSRGDRRYLSEGAIREMTQPQLSEAIRSKIPGANGPDPVGYGLGWGVSASGAFFHPGASNVDMRFDPTHTIATIWMVQLYGGPGFAMREAFVKTAEARFAPPRSIH
jgi:CubicO group peptidase (beta-lactamase class C family)